MRKVKEKVEKEKIEKLNASEFCKDLNAVLKKHKIKSFYLDDYSISASTHDWTNLHWIDEGSVACRLKYDFDIGEFVYGSPTIWRKIK